MATKTSVSFSSEGVELVGDLYLPAEAAEGRPCPGIVVTGSWTTVKEQMAGRYARRLAEWGFVTLAFDFRGYGASGGLPRDVESPAAKAIDIHAAVGFLAGRTEIDARRLGALGVCASAGYTAVNATRDERVRSVALVAPWLHDAELVRGLYGGEEGVARRVEAGRSARERYERTGEVDYLPAISGTDERAAMFGDFSGPGDYYLNPGRGAVPEWSNRFAVMAWPEWLGYDPIAVAGGIRQPLLMVHSDDAAVPDGARAFLGALAGPKDAVWTQGTQLDFYDQQPQVTQAVEAVAEHFRATLRGA